MVKQGSIGDGDGSWVSCCGAANYDEEAAQEAGYMAGFQDKAVRQGFTCKVLGIVATQLIITMLFSIAFYYSAPLKVSCPAVCVPAPMFKRLPTLSLCIALETLFFVSTSRGCSQIAAAAAQCRDFRATSLLHTNIATKAPYWVLSCCTVSSGRQW